MSRAGFCSLRQVKGFSSLCGHSKKLYANRAKSWRESAAGRCLR